MTRPHSAIILLALTLLGAPLAAQQSNDAVFVVHAGGDTLAVETLAWSGNIAEASLRYRTPPIRVRQRVRTSMAGVVEQISTTVFQGAHADSVTQRAELTFRGDSALVHVDPGLSVPAIPDRTIAAATGSVPYLNLSGLSLELILRRARAIGGDSVRVPLLVTGSPMPIVALVSRGSADSVFVLLGGVTVRVHTDATGRLLGANVPAQKAVIDRLPGGSPVAAWTGATAPVSYAAPPGAPYTAQDFYIAARAGRLAGTLTVPTHATGARLPAVVLVSGSGPQDRDEGTPGLPRWRPFREIADTLSRRGIAVLRVDDRGVGGSVAAAPQATMVNEAEDVRDVVAWLRARSDIDPSRIALVGHSSGAAVAPMVAVTDPRLRALVLMAAPATTGRKISEFQIRYLFAEDSSMPAARKDSLLRVGLRQSDSVLTVSGGWLQHFGAYDPLPTARTLRLPTLVLHGETDRQVPVTDAGLLVKAMRAGGNRTVTLRTFPRLNHLLADDASGHPLRYDSLPDLHVRRDVRGVLADWLAGTLQAHP